MKQMRKYKVTIDSLAQENFPQKKVNESKISVEERLEPGTLKQENERLQRFIDKYSVGWQDS